MAKLTKKQIAQLESIIGHFREAENYLMSDNVAVCRKGGVASTTLHYTRQDGQALYEVNKHIGSQLCLLSEGIRQLLGFIQ